MTIAIGNDKQRWVRLNDRASGQTLVKLENLPRRVGRVISQRPRGGAVRPSGFRVNLVVGRR